MELKNIQGLRALAAILVVGCHFHDFADRYGFRSEALITIGAWGVDLFFVISGFIMITVNWNKFSKPNASRAFLIRRIVRIFPPYWLVTLVIAATMILSPRLFHTWAPNISNLLPSLLLFPSDEKPILYVGWTLVFEMYFYYVFATLLNFSRNIALTVMAIWTVLVLGAQVVTNVDTNAWIGTIFNNIVLEFLLGVVAGYLVLNRPIRFAVPTIVLGVIAVTASLFLYALPHNVEATLFHTRFLLVGLPMALILYGSVALEKRRIVVPKAFSYLGDASYSLYLWHLLLYVVAGRAATALAHHGHFSPLLFICVPVAVVAGGVAIYQYVEVPLLNASRALTATFFPSSMDSKPKADVLAA